MAYAGYYNDLRTHLSLDKDSPGYRPVQRHGQPTRTHSIGAALVFLDLLESEAKRKRHYRFDGEPELSADKSLR